MRTALGICRDDRDRRIALRASELNGLDYLEVDEQDRHRLTLTFITKLGPLRDQLVPANFVICGGVRARDLTVTAVELCASADPEQDDCATLTVDHIGDFSTYTLRVVGGEDGAAHPGFDPVYACLPFSFQAGCPSPLDCEVVETCPPEPVVRPAIDYLAKDYASLRQVLLDRLTLLVEGFAERHEPDLLVTLVELLAYEGDRLSYLQDAVATEAYLRTARRRISVRRHARLVDYFVHEGANARAWLFVETSEDTAWLGWDDLFFVTSFPGVLASGTVLSDVALGRVLDSDYEVFEPIPVASLQTGLRLSDASALGRRLLSGEDQVAEFLRGQLSPAVHASLQEWGGEGDPSPSLAQQIVDDLDRLAAEQALHCAAPFTDYAGSDEARRRLCEPLRGGDFVALNWLLLHAALERELAPPQGMRFLTAHNRIVIHTWGERDCCLPRGTTTATLLDAGLQLEPGGWLLFEEVRDPATGLTEDADPAHRHVVRLTSATHARDPVLDVAVVEVTWGPEDALPFALCLSARGPAPDCEWIDEISVARGNVLLVDHGRRRLQELEAVEVDAIDEPCDGCRPEQELVGARYRPVLADRDLTFAQPLARGASARAAVGQDPRRTLPQVRLQQVPLAPPRLDLPDPLERYRNPVPLTALDPEDLVAPGALAARLQRASHASATPPADPLGAYLLGLADEATRGALADYVPPDEPVPALADGLLRALGAALDDEHLDAPDRFARDALDDATRTLTGDRTLPLDLRRLLRRWLLEQALDGALAPTRHVVRDWRPRFDLLASGAEDPDFVVEMTDDRRASLRFGDGDLGRRPDPVSRFRARYRTGSGPRGNVGAGAIAFAVRRGGVLEGLSLRPRNPLPAHGGTSPEELDEVRRVAPGAIRRDLARAVTPEDYAALAARDFASALQGAAAELVWTGSWYEAFVTLDPLGGEDTPAGLLADVRTQLEHYRRIGHALRVAPARYVALDIAVSVCVAAGHLRAHVQAALQDAFAAGPRQDGGLGFFAPDNLRLRSSVDTSEIVADAQRVEGVTWSAVTKLQRTGEGDAGELAAGTLAVSAIEIPRVDSRPGFPEFGSIAFNLDRGR